LVLGRAICSRISLKDVLNQLVSGGQGGGYMGVGRDVIPLADALGGETAVADPTPDPALGRAGALGESLLNPRLNRH
jgi:hypothetical protein